MAVDTDPRFGASIDTSDADLWSRSRLMDAIDRLRDGAAIFTDVAGTTGVLGSVRAEIDPRGFSVRAMTGTDSATTYLWRGAPEWVLLTDCLAATPPGESAADMIIRYTTALRTAIVRARERHVPLGINLPAITVDTAGTPLECSGVRIVGLPGGSIITDACAVAGSTSWDCHAASGDAEFIDLTLVASNDIGTIMRIWSSDRPVSLIRCELHAYAGMATGAIRVVADTNLTARSSQVRLDRCHVWISGHGPSAAATTSIGLVIVGGEGVSANDTTFSAFDEHVRVSGSRFSATRCAWIDPANVYSLNGNIATCGVNVLGSTVTIRDSAFDATYTPIRVGALVGDGIGSAVTVTGSTLLNAKLSKAKAGGGTIYPAVDWAGAAGLLRLEQCTVDNATGTPGVFLSGLSGLAFGLSTEGCRVGVAAANFHHLYDGGSPTVSHHHYALTSAGVTTSITNV